jgi:hypothetical protein
VLGSGLAMWQVLMRFKLTKSLGPEHLEANASIGRGTNKMHEPLLSARRPHDTRRALGEGEHVDKTA